jgi:hypothetical protein
MGDDQRPTLTVTSPAAGVNPPLTRIVVGMADAYSGLDLASFRVVADFALDGVPAGQNLAERFKLHSPGIWELTPSQPLTELHRGKLSVSVRDRQGNVSGVERVFSVKVRDP